MPNRHRFRLPRRVRADIDDEIAFHLAMRVRELVDAGMSPEEARAAAEERFGDATAVKGECVEIDTRIARRDARSEHVRDFLVDVRLAARALRRAPAYASATIATLALGLGGVTAIYSVLHAVVLAPLPFPAPERLVRVQEVKRGEAPWSGISLPDLLDWRARARAFEHIGVVQTGTGVNLSEGDEPLHVSAAFVSDDLFAVLGTPPRFGRVFDASDHAMGAAPAVLLSDALWRQRFGRDSAIVGRPISINGRPVTVRGIMPPDFRFPDESVKLWLPLAMTNGVGYLTPNGRWARLFAAYGRLAPGVSVEGAQRELGAVAAQLEREYPAQNAALGVLVQPLGTWMVAGVERMLWVLFAAAGVVLLIACVNTSSLTLVRSVARARDVAVRLAHGATTRHLLRQFLAEGTVLAFGAAVLGTALAYGAIRAFVAAGPAMPRLAEVRLRGGALALAGASALAVALVLGLVSAWRLARPDVAGVFASGGVRATQSRGRRRAQSVFVVGEVALAVVLLTSGVLLGASYLRLTAVDPRFRGRDLVTMVIHPRGAAYRGSPEAATQLYDRVLAGVRALPGISAAAVADGAPLTGAGTGWTLVPHGSVIRRGQEPSATVYAVSDDYFRTLGIPIRAGRAIDRTDLGAARVGVVNEAAVAKIFGGASPLGRRVTLGSVGSGNPPLTVVGVVGDVRESSLSSAAEPQLYVPYAPATLSGDMTLLVRNSGASSAVVPMVRAVIRDTDPSVALSDIRPMETIVAASVAGQRFTAALIGAFAVLAVLMATLGIFGVLARAVAQDARGLAIRVALGARPGRLVRSVVSRGLLLAGVGVTLGIVATFGATRVLSSLLFDVSRSDPRVLGGVVVLFIAASAIASALPALRATRTDPVSALRGG